MKKYVIVLVLIVGILSMGVAPVFASEASDAEAQKEFDAIKATIKSEISKGPISACRGQLVPLYDYEMIGFLRFLEEHFQNKSSTTSLTNVAIAKYWDYKLSLNEPILLLKPGVSGGININTFDKDLEAYGECVKIKDEYVRLGKEHMIKKIKDSSAQKKTTIMVEKYKAINNQLRDLNFQVAQMYALFVTFKNKHPFFTEECVAT